MRRTSHVGRGAVPAAVHRAAPGYVADQPRYGINFGARAQYFDYSGCWASYAYGGTASPVAQNRYYLFEQALDGRTPQAPTSHGGTVPYCGTI